MAILADEAGEQRLLGLGLQPPGSTPSEFTAFVDNEMARWSRIIRQAGIKGE
jgi:tripartite-type tricarboxylate transporter receptor subunit TctC